MVNCHQNLTTTKTKNQEPRNSPDVINETCNICGHLSKWDCLMFSTKDTQLQPQGDAQNPLCPHLRRILPCWIPQPGVRQLRVGWITMFDSHIHPPCQHHQEYIFSQYYYKYDSFTINLAAALRCGMIE